MINDQPLTIVIDGQQASLGLQSSDPLARAVIVSLFTWRRAQLDDSLPAADRMGWWGDTFPPVAGDRIGSRLWLLSRAKLLPETVARAKEYAQEALQWLVDDGVAVRIEVDAERQGQSSLALACRIYKPGATSPVDVRFTNVWDFIK